MTGSVQLNRYSPGRKDARVAEASAMLSMRLSLDGLTPLSLSSLFNLKIETAAKLIEMDHMRRQRDG